MKTKYFLFFLLLVSVLNTNYSQATIRYVSKTGTSTPPYTTWQTAADSIQKCINICSFGDTVYVANGVYQESLLIEQTIHLIGSSMDSTIIDGTTVSANDIVYFSLNNSIFENFCIKGPGTTKVGMNAWFSNINVTNCKITLVNTGLIIASSSALIKNIIINNINTRGIYDICPADTCKSNYLESIIISTDVINYSVMFFIGGSPVLKNNIIIEEGNGRDGVQFEQQKRFTFRNNLISGFRDLNVSGWVSGNDTSFIINNNSMNTTGDAILIGNEKVIVKNNIIQNAETGITVSQVVSPDYNLFHNVNTPIAVTQLGEKNIIADPMFVKDTLPTLNGNYDLHLQKHSPAIDTGDPNILDADGTRSDIGMYGGPDGERYEYLDLAPRTPRNFSASFDSTTQILLLNWDMATESDFRNYKIYRDTVSGFIPNQFNLVAQVDTSIFWDNLSNITSSSIYYRVTAVDSQDNESQPGNEIAVTITGLEPGVEIIGDYILYQNYPNPFNPSTRIGYQLKERAYVKLMVYDIKGELIIVLVNKEQNAGYYEVEFNVGNGLPSVPSIQGLASGIYLYRIEVIGDGNIPVFTDMKKMLMIK